MKFIDEAYVKLKAGDGGKGCIGFRREKYVPRGGPDGGNGGKGGHIYVIASPHRSSLLDVKMQRSYKAPRGQHGRGKGMFGASGEDLYISVPIGTVLKHAVTRTIVADLTMEEQTFLAARGGRGGRGNLAFKSPTNQAPRMAEAGEKGEEVEYLLELKLLADVGIIGRPNAGKSTLLSRLTAAKPKIASYPFTTLIPCLGILIPPNRQFERQIVLADIPGLIEGAHKGLGLGTRFLKHIERTRVLLHLIDAESEDFVDSYRIIRTELESFSPSLLEKQELVAVTKTDAFEHDAAFQTKLSALSRTLHKPAYPISAVTGDGLKALIRALSQCFDQTVSCRN